MKERVLPGLLLAVFWLLLLLYGSSTLFFLVVILVLFLAADEYVRVVQAGGEKAGLMVRLFFDFVLLAPVVIAALFSQQTRISLAALISFFLLSCWHIRHFAKVTSENAAKDYLSFAKDVFGLFYIGILGAHICLLRALPEGAAWILVATAITAGSDTGAYFVGRRFGRRKLCPGVSPKKTVEGALGGVCVAIIAALVVGFWLLSEPQGGVLVGAAVLLSLLGIMGDLTESMIKRGMGVKDSGHCLGGHGGILDRIDSLLFAIPALYYLLFLFSGST